jgi:leader peptidase (prepilin peptidase)/N-methyltransferase
MLIAFWIAFVFIIGLNVGSFLNVVVARLPMDKSLIWPGSRCMACAQPIRLYDNLPILGYLLLRGKCRTCGASFSVRYLLLELATALGLVALFVLEMVYNVHDWPARLPALVRQGWYPWAWWCGYAYHALLFCLLLAASVCDLERREIPLKITLTGTYLGLIGAILMPWPWPRTPAQALPVLGRNAPGWEWMDPGAGLRGGIYEWPFWGPLPDFCGDGGNWQTGLLTGLIGLMAGTFLLRTIGGVFGFGLGREALGMGDADLMMMAGAFLGWQPMVAGFFLSVVPAVIFGGLNLMIKGDNSLPFGPSLAAGVMTACLTWRWLGPHLQQLFFFGTLMIGLVVVMVVFLFVSSFILGRLRS